MSTHEPHAGMPAYETPAEQKFRADMTADGYSRNEVDAAIADTRPPVNPHQATADAASTGALPYGLGFLAYIPIPFFNLVIAGIVMAAVYPGQRRKSPLAAENARNAANWGLTMIVVSLVMAVLIALSIALFADSESGAAPALPIAIYPILATAHLIVSIVGLVKCNRRQVFTNPIAIPFFRRAPQPAA
ncbi:DUF4870 domain-containing protein [Marisediminicola senii]|uniref:DUF4870 domain-containing protein n=1 Tax=Marisediminicola senii TaxID=2711233 RepID=UPI0013E9FA2E|nr:DUF4870 domain-containing protein [Marisediminicola senii]